MWKVCRYTLLDLLRNRSAVGYTVLLLLITTGLFMLEADNTKALITLSQVVLAITPLLTLVFTIIWFYGQYEFTVLLAVQPLRRSAITQAQYVAVTGALLLAFWLGVGLPLLAWAPGATSLTLLAAGSLLTTICCALGLWIAVCQRDRAKAVGIGLAVWVLLVLVWDALLLWLMYSFSDRPIEPLIVPLAALNPIDLARMMVMFRIDLAALLGYTGAVYQDFFGSPGGTLAALSALLAWTLLPLWRAVRGFQRKDL
ncbi:MAG: ABC transporter permease subunit [Flavobacteriales bacterium]|nr:ABC transporter permease subunit [Flavobacteriales bacterium]